MKKIFLKTWVPPTQQVMSNEMVEDKHPLREIQPPLPQGTPPPESPSPPPQERSFSPIVCKKEPVDYDDSNMTDTNMVSAKTPQLCRDHVRGECNRSNCRFRHRIIVDIDREDLKKVFTFCTDYQNNICTRSSCSFVHADFFEKGEYLRTGNVPDFWKKKTQILAEPSNSDSLFSRTTSEQQFTIDLKRNSLKRKWSDVKNVQPGPSQDTKQRIVTNSGCESCGRIENRMRYTNNKIEDLIKMIAETRLKTNFVEKKYRNLYLLLEFALNTYHHHPQQSSIQIPPTTQPPPNYQWL